MDWLDALGLVHWLEGTRADLSPENLGPRWEGKLCEIRNGRQKLTSVYTADELLVHLGFHLSELPDELYREPPHKTRRSNNSGKPIDPEVRRRILGAVKSEPIAHVAERFKVSPSAIRKWLRQERAAA